MVSLCGMVIPIVVMGVCAILAVFVAFCAAHRRRGRAARRAAEDERRRRQATHTPGSESHSGSSRAPYPYSLVGIALPQPATDARVIEARFHERMQGNLVVGVPLEDVIGRWQQQQQYGNAPPSGNSSPPSPLLLDEEERDQRGRALRREEASVEVHDAPLPPATSAVTSDAAFGFAAVLPAAAAGMNSEQRHSTSNINGHMGNTDVNMGSLEEENASSSFAPHLQRHSAVDGEHSRSVNAYRETGERSGAMDGDEGPPLHLTLVAEGHLLLLLSPTSAAQAERDGPDTSGLVRVRDSAAATTCASSSLLPLSPQGVGHSSLTFHFADQLHSSRGDEREGSGEHEGAPSSSWSVARAQQPAPSLWIRRPSADVYGRGVPYEASTTDCPYSTGK